MPTVEQLQSVAIVIPAYNPDEQLVSVIDALAQHSYGQVIVVNDGSSSSDIFDSILGSQVVIRDTMEARFTRNVYYQLADLLVVEPIASTTSNTTDDWFGIWSAGQFFPLMAVG